MLLAISRPEGPANGGNCVTGESEVPLRDILGFSGSGCDGGGAGGASASRLIFDVTLEEWDGWERGLLVLLLLLLLLFLLLLSLLTSALL